eukprot:11978182-Heterocapsa_arctica.AAC.1
MALRNLHSGSDCVNPGGPRHASQLTERRNTTTPSCDYGKQFTAIRSQKPSGMSTWEPASRTNGGS